MSPYDPHENWQEEAYQERLAIMVFCGGLSCEEAEPLARFDSLAARIERDFTGFDFFSGATL